MSKVTSEISIRYSQIVTGTRTTMHHSRKIDFLISFHNSDARARLTRFHLSQVRKLSEAQQAVAPLRQKSRQFIARNLELSARNRELESASVSSSSSVKRERQTQGRGSRSSSTNKLKSRILLGKVSFTQFCDFKQSIKSEFADVLQHSQRVCSQHYAPLFVRSINAKETIAHHIH